MLMVLTEKQKAFWQKANHFAFFGGEGSLKKRDAQMMNGFLWFPFPTFDKRTMRSPKADLGEDLWDL